MLPRPNRLTEGDIELMLKATRGRLDPDHICRFEVLGPASVGVATAIEAARILPLERQSAFLRSLVGEAPAWGDAKQLRAAGFVAYAARFSLERLPDTLLTGGGMRFRLWLEQQIDGRACDYVELDDVSRDVVEELNAQALVWLKLGKRGNDRRLSLAILNVWNPVIIDALSLNADDDTTREMVAPLGAWLAILVAGQSGRRVREEAAGVQAICEQLLKPLASAALQELVTKASDVGLGSPGEDDLRLLVRALFEELASAAALREADEADDRPLRRSAPALAV